MWGLVVIKVVTPSVTWIYMIEDRPLAPGSSVHRSPHSAYSQETL